MENTNTHILRTQGKTTRGRVREMGVKDGVKYYGFIPGIRTRLYRAGVHEVTMVPGDMLSPIDKPKRPDIWDLKRDAEQRYPRESYAWHWRYAKLTSRILGWERRYAPDTVLLFVNEEDRVTRSPAKKQAIQDWREQRGHNVAV